MVSECCRRSAVQMCCWRLAGKVVPARMALQLQETCVPKNTLFIAIQPADAQYVCTMCLRRQCADSALTMRSAAAASHGGLPILLSKLRHSTLHRVWKRSAG